MELAPGTVSLLRMENNVTDEGGTYAWNNIGPANFDGAVFAEGAFSAGPWNIVGSCIESAVNIAEGLQTIEMYFRHPGVSNLGMFYDWWDGANYVRLQYVPGNGIRFRVSPGVYSAYYATLQDTWYHVALVTNDGGSRMYVDNIQRAFMANTRVAANGTAHIGDWMAHTHGNFLGWVDFVRLSDIVQPGPFPTMESVAILNTMSKKW